MPDPFSSTSLLPKCQIKNIKNLKEEEINTQNYIVIDSVSYTPTSKRITTFIKENVSKLQKELFESESYNASCL